jgi:hypothetical protein
MQLFHALRACRYCSAAEKTLAMILYLNGVAARSVLQCICYTSEFWGNKKRTFLWTVYREIHINAHKIKETNEGVCMIPVSCWILYIGWVIFPVHDVSGVGWYILYFKCDTKSWRSKTGLLTIHGVAIRTPYWPMNDCCYTNNSCCST